MKSTVSRWLTIKVRHTTHENHKARSIAGDETRFDTPSFASPPSPPLLRPCQSVEAWLTSFVHTGRPEIERNQSCNKLRAVSKPMGLATQPAGITGTPLPPPETPAYLSYACGRRLVSA